MVGLVQLVTQPTCCDHHPFFMTPFYCSIISTNDNDDNDDDDELLPSQRPSSPPLCSYPTSSFVCFLLPCMSWGGTKATADSFLKSITP